MEVKNRNLFGGVGGGLKNYKHMIYVDFRSIKLLVQTYFAMEPLFSLK